MLQLLLQQKIACQQEENQELRNQLEQEKEKNRQARLDTFKLRDQEINKQLLMYQMMEM